MNHLANDFLLDQQLWKSSLKKIAFKKDALTFNTFGRSTESCIHYEDELEEEEDDELEASPCLVFFSILSWLKVEETTTNI